MAPILGNYGSIIRFSFSFILYVHRLNEVEIIFLSILVDGLGKMIAIINHLQWPKLTCVSQISRFPLWLLPHNFLAPRMWCLRSISIVQCDSQLYSGQMNMADTCRPKERLASVSYVPFECVRDSKERGSHFLPSYRTTCQVNFAYVTIGPVGHHKWV